MAKFKTGRLTETAGVNERRKRDVFFDHFTEISLGRFLAGDWGDLDEEDKQLNEDALKHGGRLMGSYIYDEDDVINCLNSMAGKTSFSLKKTEDKDPDGLKIWIITEWDRSKTTMLFPKEY